MHKRLLVTCPGQGMQYEGMLSNIPNRAVWMQRAQMALGRKLDNVDSSQALRLTQNVQLCLFLVAVSVGHMLKQRGIEPVMVSGLSIGAYPAAVIAGVLSFEDAVRLVYQRGKLMQDAYPSGYGMMAIVGISARQVEEICSQTCELYVANYNAEAQTVVSGSEKALEFASRLALSLGAEKCTRLNVSVPSHCPLLEDAAVQLSKAFENIGMHRPRYAYLSASTARVLWQPKQIAQDLIWNMARSTRWHEAMVAARERGVEIALELPPGSVLTRLTAPVLSEGTALAVGETSLQDIKCRLGFPSV